MVLDESVYDHPRFQVDVAPQSLPRLYRAISSHREVLDGHVQHATELLWVRHLTLDTLSPRERAADRDDVDVFRRLHTRFVYTRTPSIGEDVKAEAGLVVHLGGAIGDRHEADLVIALDYPIARQPNGDPR